MKLAAFLCCFIVLGCGGPRMVTEHLLLYVDPASAQARASGTLSPLPYTIAVHGLSLPPLYDNANVLMRTGDYTVRFAKRASWAVRPNLMATDLLVGHLRKSLAFRSVGTPKAVENPDFSIEGEIRQIEEDLRGPGRRAALSVLLRVRRERKGDHIIFEKRYEGARPCDETSYAALAEQWSFLLLEQFSAFSRDLAQALTQEAAAAPAAEPKTDE